MLSSDNRSSKLFFAEWWSNLFCRILDVSLTANLANLKRVPWLNLESNLYAWDYRALKYLLLNGYSTSKKTPSPGKGNIIYETSQVHHWIQAILLSKEVPLLAEASIAWYYSLQLRTLEGEWVLTTLSRHYPPQRGTARSLRQTVPHWKLILILAVATGKVTAPLCPTSFNTGYRTVCLACYIVALTTP